jgi:chaperonin GroES
MNFTPLHDNILVQKIENERVTAGGIVLVDAAVEKSNQGKVLAVGPGKRLSDGTLAPMSVNIDDKILFIKGAGNPIKLEGTEYAILKETDIFAIIKDYE